MTRDEFETKLRSMIPFGALSYQCRSDEAEANIKVLLDAFDELARDRSSDTPPCSRCNRPVVFEFTVASDIWNRIVRKEGSERADEYICIWCFAKMVGDEHIPIGVNFSLETDKGGRVYSAWCGPESGGAQ